MLIVFYHLQTVFSISKFFHEDGRALLFRGETIVADTLSEIPILTLVKNKWAGLRIIYAAFWSKDLIVNMNEQHFSYEHIVRAKRADLFDTAFDIDRAFFY